MSVKAKEVRFQKELELLERAAQEPDKVRLRPRDRIRIRLRCRLCGRARGNYRKFGICRICLRTLASMGMIPGMRKASW
ncbi:MAG: 30S ribosomal protein S14 [Gemmataceae bacterium]